jgi:hypothetical protein
MADGNESPGLWARFLAWIDRRFGRRGVVTLAVLTILALAWFEWPHLSTLPGVSWLTEWFARDPLCRVPPGRFGVLVAKLENDTAGTHKRLILEDLTDFEGVYLCALDRTVSASGPAPREQEAEVHAKAREYLTDSGGAVLVWGAVLEHQGRTVPKLYLTAAGGDPGRGERYPIERTDLHLPEVFWADLSKVLRVAVAARAASFAEGHYVADRLPALIDPVRRLLGDAAGRAGWDRDARAATRLVLANALLTLGEQTGRDEPLHEAVAAYRQALEDWTRERVPLDWAMTQNNLGLALKALGERNRDPALLRQARDAFQGSFQVSVVEAGQEHRRRAFENTLAEIDQALAALPPAP